MKSRFPVPFLQRFEKVGVVHPFAPSGDEHQEKAIGAEVFQRVVNFPAGQAANLLDLGYACPEAPGSLAHLVAYGFPVVHGAVHAGIVPASASPAF